MLFVDGIHRRFDLIQFTYVLILFALVCFITLFIKKSYSTAPAGCRSTSPALICAKSVLPPFFWKDDLFLVVIAWLQMINGMHTYYGKMCGIEITYFLQLIKLATPTTSFRPSTFLPYVTVACRISISRRQTPYELPCLIC